MSIFDRSFDPGQLINTTTVSPGNTIQDDLRCYALPYGGIGFASHIMTYYTVVMLSRHLSPWLIRKNRLWVLDICLTILGLIGTTISTLYTMVKCRGAWQFILLAMWKFILSLTLSAGGISTVWMARKKAKDQVGYSPIDPRARTQQSVHTTNIQLLITPYLVSTLAGYVGLFSIVQAAWSLTPTLQTITYVYISLTAVSVLIAVFVTLMSGERRLSISFGLIVFCVAVAIGVLGALYSDWALAAIANNFAGLPDGNNSAPYWIYFISKRLPFFSC